MKKQENETVAETTTGAKLPKALLLAQMQMGNAVKDSTNPFFKSKYADLNSIREACMPALNANGIVVLQPTTHIDGKNFIRTILLHESGESMESLTEIVYNKQNDAQAQGSGITYARRYGLQSFVNVGAEDDDGHKASQPKVEPQKVIATPKPALNENSEAFAKAINYLEGGGSVAEIQKKYYVTDAIFSLLTNKK